MEVMDTHITAILLMDITIIIHTMDMVEAMVIMDVEAMEAVVFTAIIMQALLIKEHIIQDEFLTDRVQQDTEIQVLRTICLVLENQVVTRLLLIQETHQ